MAPEQADGHRRRRARGPLLARAGPLRGPRGREPGAGRQPGRDGAAAGDGAPPAAAQAQGPAARAVRGARSRALPAPGGPRHARRPRRRARGRADGRLRRGRHDPRAPARAPAHRGAAARGGADRGGAGRRAAWRRRPSRSSPPGRSPRSRRRERPRSPSRRCRERAGWRARPRSRCCSRPTGRAPRSWSWPAARPPRRSCAGPATRGRCRALAPLLGLAALAGAYPAVAGRAACWWQRAGLGAAGLWWLLLAESLLGATLLSGADPPRGWEADAGRALDGVLWPPLHSGLVALAAVWALAALVLPWLVRGRYAAVDFVAASAWAAGLGAGTAALAEWAGAGPPAASSPGRLRRARWRGCCLACSRGISCTPRDERSAQPGVQAGRSCRGHVLACLQVRGAPGRDRAQAHARDGGAQGPVAVAHLRPERVRRLALARRPQAVRGLRGRRSPPSCRATCSSTRGASRSRSSPRPRSASAPTTGYGWASSASRRGSCARPRTSRSRAEPGRRGPHDGLHGLRAAVGAAARARPRRGAARLRYEGKTAVLRSSGGVIGRSRDCDVVLSDQNVSRRHAEVRPAAASGPSRTSAPPTA